LKGAGRIYQQTFVDTYAKVAFAKLYITKTPLTAADVLNDRVLPFYEQHRVPLLRVLTDRGTEYCGKVEQHEFQLYLAVNHIDQGAIPADQGPSMNSTELELTYTALAESIARVGESKTSLLLATLALDLLSPQADADAALAHILQAERLANT
jgi:hypothetical protein